MKDISGDRDIIEVYADIWCPFAHVGLKAAAAERRRLGRQRVPLVVRAWPLELVNGHPLDAATTLEHIRDLREQVAPELFAGFKQETFPTTSIPALILAAAAYQMDVAIGESVSLALRDALFERGLDISSPAVLAEIALTHGLKTVDKIDSGAVISDWRTGQQRGVKGSPHFFCGANEAFCPALDIERDGAGHLVLNRRSEQLTSFLDSCFSGCGD